MEGKQEEVRCSWQPTYVCQECGMENQGKRVPCESREEAGYMLMQALQGGIPEIPATKMHKCAPDKVGIMSLKNMYDAAGGGREKAGESLWQPKYACEDCGMQNYGKLISCNSKVEAASMTALALSGCIRGVPVAKTHKCVSKGIGTMVLITIEEFK